MPTKSVAAIWFIYVLRDPRDRGARYVGRTDNPERRLHEHVKASKYGKTHRDHWLNELSRIGMSPTMEVVEGGTGDEWKSAEQRWISLFRREGARLTNHTDGGEGTIGWHPDPVDALRHGRKLWNNPELRPRIEKSLTLGRRDKWSKEKRVTESRKAGLVRWQKEKADPAYWTPERVAIRKARARNAGGPESYLRKTGVAKRLAAQFWNGLDDEGRRELIGKRAYGIARAWATKSPDERMLIANKIWETRRSRIKAGVQYKTSWGGQSAEGRAARSAKISASRMGQPCPEAAKISNRERMKALWAELRNDPQRYREFIDRRAKAIGIAKAEKKLAALKASAAE